MEGNLRNYLSLMIDWFQWKRNNGNNKDCYFYNDLSLNNVFDRYISKSSHVDDFVSDQCKSFDLF